MISQSIQLKQRFMWESQEPCYSVDGVELKEIFGTWYKMNMVSNGDEPTHSLQFELDEKAAAGRDTWSSCPALLMLGTHSRLALWGIYFIAAFVILMTIILISNHYH